MSLARRVGCAVGVSVPLVLGAQSPTRWSITVEQRYGDRPGTELANPRTLAVDGAGRLYVGDTRPAAVKVFNADGTLLRVLGREGGGPGEYRNPWIAARGGVVVVHDPAQSRTTVFDTAGRVRRSWTSFCCHQNEIALDRAGRVVIPAVLSAPSEGVLGVVRMPYVRYTLDGRVADTIIIRGSGPERLWTVARRGSDGKPAAGSTSIVIPFTPRQQFAWDPVGGYVSGWSKAMRMFRSTTGRDSSVLDIGGDRPMPIPLALRRAPVDSAIAQFTQMVGPGPAREAVQLSDVPTTAPAFQRLLIDEERNIWAQQTGAADSGTTAFRVFGPTGSDLGTATLPLRFPEWGGVTFGPGAMYVRSESEDGEPIVVRLRLVRTR